MKLHTPLIALMVGSLFIVGMFTIFVGLEPVYSKHFTIDNNFSYFKTDKDTAVQDLFDTINESRSDMDTLNQDFENKTVHDSASLFSFYGMAFTLGKNIFHQLTTFKDIIGASTQILGVPNEVTVVLVSILLFMFVLTVIYLLLGR